MIIGSASVSIQVAQKGFSNGKVRRSQTANPPASGGASNAPSPPPPHARSWGSPGEGARGFAAGAAYCAALARLVASAIWLLPHCACHCMQ